MSTGIGMHQMSSPRWKEDSTQPSGSILSQYCLMSFYAMVIPDAGRDRGQEEKGMTEDEMAGWHHRFDGHEFE